jgi:IS5 family transposase
MRQFHEAQLALRPAWGVHQHSRELAQIARLLDAHPQIAERVQADLLRGRRCDTGRPGLDGGQVLRVALLKQIHGLSYRELEFHLQDSEAFRAFVGLGFDARPSYQALQANVKRIGAQTWEAIHRILIGFAQRVGIERGQTIRGDTTVVDAAIAEPADSGLLWDCVRVASRLMHRMARRKPSLREHFSDHTRRAKRRAYAIKFLRRRHDMQRQYRDLIRVAQAVRHDAAVLVEQAADASSLSDLVKALQELLPRMDQVLAQAKRRVLEGEKVPVEEKIVSIFEPHTDILVKDNREVRYGHKVCLTGGKSSLVLDCVIEEGNPADATLVERTLERHIELFGRAPRQAAFDGGFASGDNLQRAKELGVEDIAFHRKLGLEITDMVRSAWVFRRLRDFRSGIEGVISTLKRAFGMGRCPWRSFESFRAYVWASVTSFNLIALARHLLAREFR